MIYLLDTDTCVDVLRSVPEVLSRLAGLSPEDCGVSAVTVYELECGVGRARAPERELRKIERLLEWVTPLPFDREAGRAAARIRTTLEKRGKTIGPYDLLIAGHALAVDLTLVTRNRREFERVTGLRVEAWEPG